MDATMLKVEPEDNAGCMFDYEQSKKKRQKSSEKAHKRYSTILLGSVQFIAA